MSLRNVLSILLVAQLGMAAITWWPREPAGGQQHPFLELERDAISEIEIARSTEDFETEVAGIHLVRENDRWLVVSASGYPATESKVDELVDRLIGLAVKQPVVTRETSHNALNVGEQDYGRRIKITAGDRVVELVMGAATNKSVNLRLVGEDDVYRAHGESEWAFRDAASTYYDTSYVAAEVDALSALSLTNDNGTLLFEKSEDGWTLAGLEPDETSDADAIETFLGSLVRVRMSEPVGKEIKPEYGFGDTRVDWTVVAENESIAGGYQLGAENEGGDKVYVKAVDSEFVVSAAGGPFGRLREAVRSDFLTSE